jgi:hypothetical protein
VPSGWFTEGHPSAAPCLPAAQGLPSAVAAPGEAPSCGRTSFPSRSALFIDPPGSMQRGARGVGTGVQILKLLPKFSMTNFKNRLTTTKCATRGRTSATAHSTHCITEGPPLPRPPILLPWGCLQRSLRLEGRPALPGRPPKQVTEAGRVWEQLMPRLPRPLCPLHRLTGINAERCAWSRDRGPDSETFAKI